jgi:hypothetical protein
MYLLKEKLMRLSSTVLVFALTAPALAFAQDPTPAAPAAEAAPAPAVVAPALPPAVAPVESAPLPAPAAPAVAWTFEGLVDAYYLYNFTGDPKTQAPAFRNFDTTANSFTLNLVKLGAQADTDLVAFRADIGAGHTAYLINTGNLGVSGGATVPEAVSLYGNGFLVEQAFATLKIAPTFTLDFGRFVTTAGAEVIEANKNWLYSRSLMFYGIPLLHTGARLNLQVNPTVKIQASLVNGWNNDPDSNSDKTYGLSLALTPPDTGLSAFLTTYIGIESGSDTTILFDAVVTKDIGPLSLSGNFDYYKLDETNWFGFSVMGRFLVSDAFNLGARFEYIKNKNTDRFLLSGTPPNFDGALYEATLQGAYTVGKHYELRAEVRVDMSDKELFAKGNTPKKNQATGLLAALAYF